MKPNVIRKLSAEHVTQKNYDKKKALAILGQCVMPVPLKKCLELYESEIINGLSK